MASVQRGRTGERRGKGQRSSSSVLAAQPAQPNSDDIRYGAFECAHGGHLKAAAPPGANRDQRLGRADRKVRRKRDDGREDYRRVSAQKEKWNDGDKGSHGGRQGTGECGGHRIAESFFGGV